MPSTEALGLFLMVRVLEIRCSLCQTQLSFLFICASLQYTGAGATRNHNLQIEHQVIFIFQLVCNLR